jgi:hypothetical protein
MNEAGVLAGNVGVLNVVLHLVCCTHRVRTT